MAAAQNMAMTTTQKIIAIAVTIIIISTVAIPVIDDVQKEIATTGNNSAFSFMASTGSDITTSITNVDSTISIGDLVISKTGDVHAATILISSGLIINTYSSTLRVTDISNDIQLAQVTAIDITSGAYSYTVSGTDYSGTLAGDVLFLSDTGTYGYFDSISDLKLNSNSKVYVTYAVTPFRDSSNNSLSLTGVISGTIKDGMSGTLYKYVSSEFVSVSSSSTINAVDEDGIMYSLTNIESSAIDSSVTYNRTVTGGIFAPIEYKYISDSDESLINLIGILPIMLILVPLMMAVRMMALKRN